MNKPHPRGSTDGPSSTHLPLGALQETFFGGIRRDLADGEAADLARELGIEGDLSRSSRRFSIYAQMYARRLLDVLIEDYPQLSTFLGDRFEPLAKEYLAQFPSRNPSLRFVGQHLESFLARHPLAHPHPFLSDLANLEWQRVEVFDRPNEPTLSMADLAQLAEDDWSRVAFRPIGALSLFTFDHLVTELWQALDQDQSPLPEVPALHGNCIAFRRDYLVYHRLCSEEEALALRALQAGAPFSRLCEMFGATSDDLAVSAQRAFSHLAQWIADGLLAGYELPDA